MISDVLASRSPHTVQRSCNRDHDVDLRDRHCGVLGQTESCECM